MTCFDVGSGVTHERDAPRAARATVGAPLTPQSLIGQPAGTSTWMPSELSQRHEADEGGAVSIQGNAVSVCELGAGLGVAAAELGFGALPRGSCGE
jgi:hypothetical protein